MDNDWDINPDSYVKDPEGNWLEMLYQPPKGIPKNK